MPSIYDLKPAFQSLLRPTVRVLAEHGITANQVTIAAMMLSVAQGVYLALAPDPFWPLVLLPLVLLLRMALNAIDGMLAREFNQKSRLGAVLNEIGDVVSDVCLYLPLATVVTAAAAPLVLFVVVAVIAEFAGVVALQVGATRRYDGPMGKSDRAFWISVLAVALATGVLPVEWVGHCGWFLVGLSILTVIHRLRRALDSQPTSCPVMSDTAARV
jgi:CDP-diacylglycerol--glycerol-3-phosphate 3-phosphatidyltransferase